VDTSPNAVDLMERVINEDYLKNRVTHKKKASQLI
jgi:hypothetical protein